MPFGFPRYKRKRDRERKRVVEKESVKKKKKSIKKIQRVRKVSRKWGSWDIEEMFGGKSKNLSR